ncbi:MAG TPA: Ig-like domain-containing protein, partial [Gaiellaceae bacterium]|nr:Ig-like domain-containing protein [Gaiellaceae bacterium]
MAMLPPQRPRDDGSPDAAGAAVLRGTAPLRAAALTALVASAFLALVAVAGLGGAEGDVPSFLGRALGPEEADAPLARTPAPGVGVRIHADGYTLRHGGSSVSVASEDVGGGDWRRHAHGVTRPTGFGAETIVVDGTSTEEFLTVTTRQGERTWRWRLATRLVPRLGRDGSVAFLDPTRHLVTGLVIDPVRILDERGEDVTPAGLRWSLRTKGSASWLALELDDAGLPLPYVIDPAVSHRAAQTAVQAGGTSLVVAVPAGVQANDLLVAHVARGGNAAFTPPAGWTAAGGGTYGNFLNQATYYRIATGSEPASYTWTWSGSRAAAGGMSAYYGAKASDPVDVVGALTTANGTTVTAASVTTTAPDALVLAFFATNSDAAYSTAAGMTERYEAGTAGAASVAADDLSQPAPGATGAKTSTASASGRNAGHQVAFQVDDVDPVVAQGDPGTPLAGTISLVANASDTDSAVAQVQLQRSPAGAGTWTDVGAPDVASPYTASFDTTTVPDGLYDLRAVATDAAGNVAASAAVGARRVDNTAPSSTTAFPAAAATYGASGWNAGCAPSGLCGTAADGAGSGLQSVEVSVRQGTGDYWDGGAFASAAEAWHAATLAAGDWSYALSAAQLPADGDYTIRVRSTDAAGNVEAPAARTFTFDATPPETTIDSAPASPTDTADATFDVSASEGGSTFECRLDGGAWSGCASPVDYTGLADGSHTFDVRATDSAGNTDSTPASSTWLVDTAAPTSTTAFPAAGGEYGAAGWDAGCPVAGLCGTAADGTGAGVQSVDLSIRQGAGDYWDGSAFASASEVWVTATLAAGDWSYALDASSLAPDGGYTVRVRATDAAGNAESPSSRAFVVDTTAPSALVAFPAGAGEYRTGSWNAGCATVGFCGTASDATSGVAQVEVSVKRGADDLYWDGDSFDAAGETFFPATVAGSDWSYAFPAASFPADGSYTVHARATDEAGNTESGSSRTFSLDDTDPSALFTFPAPGASYGGAGWDAGCTAAGLCGTASDSGSGVAQVEVSLKLVGADLYWDGSSFSAPGETFFPATLAGGDWSYGFPAASFPADGSYTLHARATDDAGNTESGPTRTFTYDTAAPATTIDSSPADPTTATDADFSFSASEGGSTFECRLDGGPWGACSSPESYAGLADGDHTFDVRATDAAGNTEGTPAGFSWTVDTAAPSSTVAFPAAAGEYGASGWNAGCATSGACGTVDDGPAGSGVQAVKVSFRQGSGDYWNGASFSSAGEMLFDATVAGGSWSRPFPASNFPADGDYTVRVYAVDEAGNAESPSSRTFAFDGTPPAGSLTAPADGAAVAGTVTLSADSTDSGAGVASAAFMRRPAGGGAWQPV